MQERLALYIFVDGYNVLKFLKDGPIGESERRWFLRQLQQYTKTKNHNVTIIFDGASEHDFLVNNGMVRVLYAGVQTADERLIYEMGRVNGSVLLISNDRGLCADASDMGICSMGVGDFWHYVLVALGTKKTSGMIVQRGILIKTAAETNSELDTLMEHYCKNQSLSKDTDQYKLRCTRRSKDTKLERKLLSILRKL